MNGWTLFWTWIAGLFRKAPTSVPVTPSNTPVVPAPQPSPPVPGPVPPVPGPLPTSITMVEFIMGRDKIAPLSDTLRQNADVTVSRVNRLLAAFGSKRDVSSGYRPKQINDKTPNAAEHSKHEDCEACDLEDHDGKLWGWVLCNMALMKELGLWIEDPRWTPSWLHVQSVPPESGDRVFVPSKAPPLSPNKWDGIYDHRYDGKA